MQQEANNLFDRSFDFLEHLNNDTSFTTSFTTNDTSFDTSFDSAGFEFSAAIAESQLDRSTPAGSLRSPTTLFPFDPFQIEDPNTTANTTLNTSATTNTNTNTTASSAPLLSRPKASPVRVFLHEQVSALYDDFSSEGSVSVTGSVRIKASSGTRSSSSHNTESSTILLRLKDPHSCLQRVQQSDDVSCQLMRDDRGQRSLRIKLEKSQASREVHVADFYCMASLRPVPLLIKTKVGVANGHARVGFKIRANPHLEFVLRDVVILLAVPPDVDGEHCKLSRAGGSWEELKRTVSWRVDQVEPGKALEILAQFPLLEATSPKTPRFPVLVRCNYGPLFCGIEIETGDETQPIRVEERGCVLHRKV